MWITARKVYTTKCVLWILGVVIIPIFIWWRPSHIYETDKSSIVIEDTHRGRKFEFDATNTFGYTLHAQYVPQCNYYTLLVDGYENCDCEKCVEQDSFIYKDTHIFTASYGWVVVGSIICMLIQLSVVIFCIYALCFGTDIEEKPTPRPSKYGFLIDNVCGCEEDDFWFSKVFGLYITEKELVRINKFFGFDNPYFKKYENN